MDTGAGWSRCGWERGARWPGACPGCRGRWAAQRPSPRRKLAPWCLNASLWPRGPRLRKHPAIGLEATAGEALGWSGPLVMLPCPLGPAPACEGGPVDRILLGSFAGTGAGPLWGASDAGPVLGAGRFVRWGMGGRCGQGSAWSLADLASSGRSHQGVQLSPLGGFCGSSCGDPQGNSMSGDALWLPCVPWEWRRGGALVRALLEVHPGASWAGDGPSGPHPARCLTLCCSWAVGWTGHPSQLACSVGQAVPFLHPERPGFWGNHLPFGSYQFHRRSRGSSPQGPPWAC